MSFLSRSAAALVALNAASSALAAATTTSTGYIALYSYGLQIPVNVNPTYETVQGSSTKWIGKNTQWLTDEIVTSTTTGKTTTSTKDIGAGASTTTASASGSSVPALGFTISPELVSDLESAAAAACAGGSKKRQASCAISANALAAQLESTLAASLSAADVAMLQSAVGSAAAISAASLIISGTYLASKSIPMNVGVNIPSLKAAASKAATSSSSSSSSSSAAVTTITNAIDAYQAVETDTAALLAQGSYIISQALHTPDPFLDSTGQTFSCNNFADPDNTMTMPSDYCVCQDGKSYSTTSGPNPCPYTAAPKSTVVFTTKSSSTPTPTSTTATSTNTPGSGITIGQPSCADPSGPTFPRDAASSAVSVVCASAVGSSWTYSPSATLSPGDIAKNAFYQGSVSQKFSDISNDGKELALTISANKIGCSPGQDYSIDFKAMGQDKCVSQWMATVDGCDTSSGDKHGGVVYQDCILWTAGMVQQ